MKFAKQAKIGLIVILMFALTTSKTYNESYADYCSSDVIQSFNTSEAERIKLRSESRPPYASLDAVEEYIKQNSVGKIASEIGNPVILTFILAAFCILTFLTFWGFFCCCDRANSASDKTATICWIASIVLFLGFTGLFVTSMVFMGKAWRDSKSSNCFFASATKNIIEGVNSTDFNYIGLSKLINVFKEFGSEVSIVSTLAADFEAINKSKIREKTSSALSSLPPFYEKFKDSVTSDGTGEKSKPISIQGLNSNINDAIFAEFSVLDQTATRVVNAALVGKGYSQSLSYVYVQSSVSSIANNIESLVDEMIDVYDKADSGFQAYNTSFTAGLATSLGIGSAFLVFGILSLVYIGLMIFKQNNVCRSGVKIFININAFLTLIISLLAIVVFGTSITIGTGCNFLQELLDASQPINVFNKVNITFDDVVVKSIIQCLPNEASGNLTVAIAPDLSLISSLEVFIDGFSTFNSLQASLTQSQNGSQAIQMTAELWKQFKISVKADQPKAINSLGLINEMISCDNTSFQLNALNCTSDNCKGIYNTSSFSSPTCSSNPAYANSLFINLKSFTNDEDNLLGSMIKDLTESQTPTPGSLNTAARNTFISLLPSIQNIAYSFNKTFSKINQMQNGFIKNTNCTVLRYDLQNLENAMCFSLNKNLYMFALFLILAVVMAILNSWVTCCTLRYLPGDLDHVFFIATQNDAGYTVQDTEIQNMNSVEISKEEF